MSVKRFMKFKHRGLVMAIGALVPAASAHADFYILGNSVIEPMGSQPMEAQRNQQKRVDILGNTLWAPRDDMGAQGPIRGEENPQAEAVRSQDDALWQSLTPLIGTDR